jgi:hypothetical protein
MDGACVAGRRRRPGSGLDDATGNNYELLCQNFFFLYLLPHIYLISFLAFIEFILAE